MSDRNHLLPHPIWAIVLRGVQLLFAIIIMGLAGFGVANLPSGEGFEGAGLNMYTAIQTIITVVYILVTFFFLPIAYNYWAVLGLDVLGVIFWLCSFAVLSSEVQNYKSDFDNFGGGDDCFDGLCFKRSIIQKRFVTFNNYYHTMTALAVFGAFQFILFVVTLTFTSIWIFRHKKAGGHCIPSTSEHNASSGIQRKPVGDNETEATQVPMGNISNV